MEKEVVSFGTLKLVYRTREGKTGLLQPLDAQSPEHLGIKQLGIKQLVISWFLALMRIFDF